MGRLVAALKLEVDVKLAPQTLLLGDCEAAERKGRIVGGSLLRSRRCAEMGESTWELGDPGQTLVSGRTVHHDECKRSQRESLVQEDSALAHGRQKLQQQLHSKLACL
jgi:hypothetical protein